MSNGDAEQYRQLPAFSLDARYIAAWSEMNVRITQRQNLITIYTGLALASLGAASSAPQNAWPGLWRVAYMVPASTMMFAALLLMHEKMLHNLQVFLAALEDIGAHPKVPTYHSWGEYTKYAARARVAHDYVCGGLILGFNALAGAVIALQPNVPGPYDAAVQVVLLISVISSLVVLKRINDFRHKPERGLHGQISSRV